MDREDEGTLATFRLRPGKTWQAELEFICTQGKRGAPQTPAQSDNGLGLAAEEEVPVTEFSRETCTAG